MQTKAIKVYTDPNALVVAKFHAQAADAATKQTPFDQDTAFGAEIILRSAQVAISNQNRRPFIRNVPHWLRAKLLEQLETTTIEDLCLFARKQLSIPKTHESVIDAFSEMGPSVTETTVTALTKLNTKREAMK